MPQTIRLTITSDIEKALKILRQSTLGTLNTTELIKMAIGGFAQIKIASLSSDKARGVEMSPHEIDAISSRMFYEWSKEDKTQDIDNIAHPKKLKPFIPKDHV